MLCPGPYCEPRVQLLTGRWRGSLETPASMLHLVPTWDLWDMVSCLASGRKQLEDGEVSEVDTVRTVNLSQSLVEKVSWARMPSVWVSRLSE